MNNTYRKSNGETFEFEKLVRTRSFDGFPACFEFVGGPHDGKVVMFRQGADLLARLK